MHDLRPLSDAVRSVLDAKHAARELGLRNSRQVIRRCATAIRSLHRGEIDKAEELMGEAEGMLREAQVALADHPDILFAGFVSDAAKEYAEARTFAAYCTGGALPLPDDLGVGAAPYLNGIGETVGELRRRMLDQLRSGDLDTASTTFEMMEEILELLADLDYPDGMTGGLRRTTDVARALVERSRSDLTSTIIQERLRRELADS